MSVARGLDQFHALLDIYDMRKNAKAKTGSKARGSARSSEFIGRTKEGFPVPKPDFKPESFTVRQLQEAVRAVRRRQAAAQAG